MKTKPAKLPPAAVAFLSQTDAAPEVSQRQRRAAALASDFAHDLKTEGRTARPFRTNPHE